MREDDGTFICDSSEFPLCKTALNIDDRVCWRCGSSEIKATAVQPSLDVSADCNRVANAFVDIMKQGEMLAAKEWIKSISSPSRATKASNTMPQIKGRQSASADELWLEYITDGNLCGLCGNQGTLFVLLLSAMKPCICPNGRAIKSRQDNG